MSHLENRSNRDGPTNPTTATLVPRAPQSPSNDLRNNAPLSPVSPSASSKMSGMKSRRRSAPELPFLGSQYNVDVNDSPSMSPSYGTQQNGREGPPIKEVPYQPSVQWPLSPPLTDDEGLLYKSRERAQSMMGFDILEGSDINGRAQPNLTSFTSKSVISDIIRSIPRPQFPIRVFQGQPGPFSLEAQRTVMRWSHERRHFWPDPVWLSAPNTANIRDLVWPYLKDLGADYQTIGVEFLAEGGFNRVFTIHTIHAYTRKKTDYILRVALPVDPYYKTESDVATTEIVRHFTTVPVPTIYAYDSSTNNSIGMEWMLMEKVEGHKLDETWTGMDYNSKLRVTKTLGEWTAQLARISWNKIGSIFMRYTTERLEFYVGRSVTSSLSQENRLKYEVYRGPFETLERFYASIIEATSRDIDNLARAFHSGSFRFESISPNLRGTFLDQHILYYLDGHPDWTEADWHAEQTKELAMLSHAINALKAALPDLCAKSPETSRELCTILAHNDMSRRNIFVDNFGTPVALLDWEAIQLRPLLCLTDPPDFIRSNEELYEPELNPADDESTWRRLGWSEEDIERCQWANQRWFVEHMEDFICTKLRLEYESELRQLGCPLADAVWENYSDLDCQLQERVLDFSRNVHDHSEWIEMMLSPEEDSDISESEECEDGLGEGDAQQLDTAMGDFDRSGHSSSSGKRAAPL